MKTGTERSSGHVGISKLLLSALFTCIVFFAAHATCFALTVELQWDPNTEADLAGYKVYYKADSNSLPFDGAGAVEGASPVDVRNQTTATISGLDSSRTYYFAITAYSTSGVESSYSNIVVVADTLPPTITLTSPTNNSTVSGTVSLNASASDNVGVSKVEYYVNGTLSLTDTATPYVYSWNTSALASGNYTLMAKAYDVAGNVGQSSNVVVTVANDTTAPVTSLTAPTAGATVSGTVTVSATASDNVGVTRVEFYGNGALLAATNTAPYTYSWNTTSIANGSYTLTVKAYDNTGNVGQSSAVTVTVANVVNDTTAPTVAISAPATSATVSGTVAVNATAADNVSVTKVEFYLNGVLKSTDTAAPFSYNWDTTAVANGSYSLTAMAYDAKGNVGQSSTVTVSVTNALKDTTAPTVSISAPVASATVSGTVMINAIATDNVSVTKVTFFVNDVLKSTDTVAPYSYNWDTTTLASGTYTLMLRAYDAAGNISISKCVNVTVIKDMIAPTVVISAPAASATVSGTVAVQATATDNVGIAKVEFYQNGVLKGTDTAAPYSYSWDTSSVANGSYSLTVKAYDAANNVTTSSAVTVTVFNDTIAPTAAISAPGASATVSGTVAVQVTATDNVGVAKVEFYQNGVLKGTDTTAPYSYSWDTSSVANGSYSLTVKAYDAAKNVTTSSAVAVTVFNDTIAPTVVISAPAASATVSGTVAVQATATDNVGVTKVEFYQNGVLKGTDATAPYSYSWDTSAVANGSYTLTVRAYDVANNVTTSSVVSVTVFNDVIAPTTTISSPANSAIITGIVAVNASATDNVGVTKVEFYLDGVLQTTISSAPYIYSWDTIEVANGSYTLSALAYDAAGNVGQSGNAIVTVANDMTAPELTITAKSVKEQSIGGAVSDNVLVASVMVKVGDDGVPVSASISGNAWTCTISLVSGVNTILVTATDSSGNSSTVTTTLKKR